MDTLAQVAPDVTRPTFWQIGPAGELVFYYLAAVAIAIFLYGSYERVRSFAAGPADPIDRLDDLGRRVLEATRIVASNEKQFDRDWYGGLMHTLIFWGFLTLLVGTTILAIDMDIWTKALGQPSFFVGAFYVSFSFVMDALGFLFVVGVGMALYRRYWIRNGRLWGKHTGPEDDLFVWSLFLLGVGGFLQEGIRILGMGMPDYEVVSFVGWTVANSLAAAGVSEAGATAAYGPLWWSHAVIALLFVAAVPYAKPLHMLTSFANVVTRDEQAGTRLPGVPEDASPEEIGFTGLEDMSWKQRLDQDACTKCGRCSSVCPAAESGRPLDPRDVILDLKEYRHAVENGEADEMDIVSAQSESVIDSETMEACMTCMACMDACPVEIEHVPQFTEMNRRLTETGQMDENVQEAMMNVFQNGNSFGEPERKRPDWTDELDFEIPDAREESVEYLWYVGDYPSYDDRNKTVARALARIFEAADVSYGILYEDEKNDGNDVRRVGEEGLFEMLAEENIETLEAADFETLVTTDPHSFNTFRNEYEDFGWEDGDSVHHYTQVVEELIQGGKLPLDASDLDRTVTFHDPCHLGRYNDEFEAPRAVLDSTGVTVDEMPRNRADSFCCGGGGGGLWMDADEEIKPSEERIREALEDTRAGDDVEQFVVSCPMCMTMYEDGRKTGGYEDDIEVVDLAELVWEALEGEQAAAGEPVAAD
ncbi:Membrane associated Fe-S oxidoreductase [Halanaeroarchaeum sp. HSR-CO]|uniref:4Fe-4S dicluster domain-containing protein n=1 Tax=Halanaeroarchaeum sp. HSR-CO TaxID=2866382 RepID=UPI00217CEE90|nr:(Fe-S)-binding protein [Halanaeroarchaeum sp. HSR-CO]UWG46448.1 Membrane associated Fe-S oxidoreductase [Halanaeroarchaeum sp. HSR-CO]